MRRSTMLGLCSAVLLGAGLPGVAGAAVYRDPPVYKGPTRAPAAKALPDPTPPPTPPVTLSGAGTFPSVLVDPAGTAHVAWNEDRGTAADVVVYCRMKRGATGCDARTELQWEKPYGAGDDPQFNSGDAPHIVQVGTQLVIFQHRYPTFSDKPDGQGGSSTVLAWTSGDGGTSWAPNPAIVGRWGLDQMAVIGPEDNPTVLGFGVDPLCPTGAASACVTAFRSGQFAGDADTGNLSAKQDANYDANLTLDEQGLPVVATEDLTPTTFLRRWTGVGSPTDPAMWTAPSPLPFDEISLAGGPLGVFLLAQPPKRGPYAVHRLTRAGTGYAAGTGAQVAADPEAAGGQFGVLDQSPTGRLTAAWANARNGVQLAQTAGPATGAAPILNPARVVSTGSDNGQLAVASAGDGGGFVAFNHTGFVNREGQIQIAGFGSRKPTGQPGIAGLPGGSGATAGGAGTNGSCSELSFGSFVASSGGCLLKGTGVNKDVYVTGNELNLWGLRIIPKAGAKIIINPKTLQLDTTGSVRVVVSAPEPVGDVTLFEGVIHRDLSAVVPGTTLFEFPSGLFKANILGFDVGADIKVRMEKDGVHIPVDLKLPPAFGGFSGHAELVADRTTGLHLNSLHIHLGPIPLGALIINAVDLDYQGQGDVWSGAGSVTVPAGGTIDASVKFVMGDFNEATISFTPATPIPIGPFVYLVQMGGGFKVDPVTISANATIGAGAAVDGKSPVSVKGTFTMTFPKTGPADFHLTGNLSVFMFQLAQSSLDFQSDGYAAFKGHTALSLGPLSVDANLDGFVDATTGNYGAGLDGKVELCVDVPVEICAGARAGAAVSNKGFAACARFNPPDPIGGFEAGLTYPWADFDPVFLVNPALFSASILTHIGGCHVDEYHVPPPRAGVRQAGGNGPYGFDVPAGAPSESVLVQGTDGKPDVTVTGPGGQRFASGAPSNDGFVMTATGVNASYLMLRNPAPGRWTVTPNAGSPAVAQVLQADGYTPATVTGRLGGRGRLRTLTYAVAHPGHGQVVSFRESGAFGTKLLGDAKATRGVFRFTPADAAGGRRTVEAVVTQDGLVTDTYPLGSYVAPGPAVPVAVGALKVRRVGTNVTVTWRAPARSAARYAVTLGGVHGTRLGKLVGAGTRRVTFSAVRRDERVTVSVRGLSAKGRFGRARLAVLRG